MRQLAVILTIMVAFIATVCPHSGQARQRGNTGSDEHESQHQVADDQANSPWPVFGHDPQRTGQSQYNGPQTNNVRWSYTTGRRVSSSPAIGADGTVYVGSYDDKLYALGPDGSLKWSYTTGDWVESSPAIGADGTLYVGSHDGKLYAFQDAP
jgi:hypothetical protein